MNQIVVLQPDGSLKTILVDDYSNPEYRLCGYVGPVRDTLTIEKGNEIALSRITPQRER